MKREKITVELADKLMKPGEYVHTFESPAPGVLVGADWSRKDLLESFEQFGVELSGAVATSMDHAICFNHGNRWVFVATKAPELVETPCCK